MGLLDELEAYKQPNGLYSNQKNPGNDSSGNCIAISSVAMWLAFKLNETETEDGAVITFAFNQAITACQVSGYSGLLNRSPTKTGDQEGWDDYVCLLTAAGYSILGLPIVLRILAYSKKYFCSFDNVTPGHFSFESCFARYPQFLAHLRFSNETNANFIFKILWCIGVFFSAFSNDATTCVLNFMIIQALPRGSSFLCTLFSAFWMRLNAYSVKDHVAMWLSIDGKTPNIDHPIVKYWGADGSTTTA